ncbi:MAG: hypothetical protein ACJA02_000406 [Myxococcota bacterium]|jgi:hypothetical protein
MGLGLVFLGFFGTGETFFFGFSAVAFLEELSFLVFAGVFNDFSVDLTAFLGSESMIWELFTFFFQQMFWL